MPLGQALSLAELKTTAAQNAKKWFTIRADEEVPYARAVEVLETLKAAGVAEITFREAQMGDGRYRIANRTGIYPFDEAHKFSICMPRGLKQWFTVIWPAKDGKLARRLRFYPEADAETQSRWAVVWEPGTDVLWWADGSYVGRMNLDDPTQVQVAREPRLGHFSAEFALPEEAKTAFRGLGLAVGRLGQTGPGPELGAASKEVLVAEEFDPKASDTAGLKVRPGGGWSEAWHDLARVVAASRGLQDWTAEDLIAWGAVRDGLRTGVLMASRAESGEPLPARLVIRNVSPEPITVHLSPVLNRIDADARAADGTRLPVHKVVLFGTDPSITFTFKPGEQLEFAAPPVQFGVERDADGKVRTPGFPICGVETGPGTVSVRFSMTNGQAPDSGEIEMDIANR